MAHHDTLRRKSATCAAFARAVETEAKGLALAAGLKAQQDAVGKEGTTLVNVVTQLAQGSNRFVPEILVVGGENGGIVGGVGAQLMKLLGDVNSSKSGATEKEG